MMRLVTLVLLLGLTHCGLAQDLPFKIEWDARENNGVRQITVNGKSYVVGCGFGLIGSVSGVDDENNITSCREESADGKMVPFNGNKSIPPLPFSLKFSAGDDTAGLKFEGSVGPAATDYSTVSLPFDCKLREFTHVRFPVKHYETGGYDGSSGGEKSPLVRRQGSEVAFKDLRPAYFHLATKKLVRIGRAVDKPAWGQLIGDDITIEVRMTRQSRKLDLFFVDHPGIDVRNIEFSFGRLKKGETLKFAGEIKVMPTGRQPLQ